MSQLIGSNRIENYSIANLDSSFTGTVSSGSNTVISITPASDKFWLIDYFPLLSLSAPSDQGATSGTVEIQIGHVPFGPEFINITLQYNESGRVINGIELTGAAGTINTPKDAQSILQADLLISPKSPGNADLEINIENKTDTSLDIGQLVTGFQIARTVIDQ